MNVLFHASPYSKTFNQFNEEQNTLINTHFILNEIKWQLMAE